MATDNRKFYLHPILISICITCVVCYEPNWNSLDTRKNPEWYDEGKIGIFLHWGVYSVPGNMVWFWYYWQRQKLPEYVQFMKDHYPPNFQYADFAPQFRAEFFDADEWAKIFKDAGARLVHANDKYRFMYNIIDCRQDKSIEFIIILALVHQGSLDYCSIYSRECPTVGAWILTASLLLNRKIWFDMPLQKTLIILM